MNKFIFSIMVFLAVFSCKKETVDLKQVDAVNQEIMNSIIKNKELFDWNEQTTDFIFEALETCPDRSLTIGYTTDLRSVNQPLKEAIIAAVEKNEGTDRAKILLEANDKLSTLKISVQNKNTIELIRNMPGVEFVEVTNFQYNREFFICDQALENSFQQNKNYLQRINNGNPGDYDPNTSTIPYDQFLGSIDGGDAKLLRNHNLTYVYDSLKKFDGLEVAVLDNGVMPDRVPYYQVGNPTFKMEGYHCANPNGCVNFDGPNPRRYDLGGLSPMISGQYEHGTQQITKVYNIMPKGQIRAVRASQWVFILFPTDFRGIIASIMAMADDPTVKVISMSMGGIIENNELRRAVQYYTSRDKIFVSASGTFLNIPALKDLIGVVFPANMPETVATTGIEDTRETNGVFVLGENSTSGPENDFVVEDQSSSSPSVSATAGMFGLIWSINPNLTAAQIRDIFIRSSNYYISQGQKHPLFGWGKVDCKLAAKMVEATL